MLSRSRPHPALARRWAKTPALVGALAVSLIGLTRCAGAQTVEAGPHAVGFQVLRTATASDSIPVYLWYPAREGTGHAMPYGDYLVLTQTHRRGAFGAASLDDWEAAADLPRGISQAVLGQPLSHDQWQAITDRTTTARRDADPLPGPFPLVLGGLNDAQSVASLAEHLASHGYVVASGPRPREVARQERSAPLVAVASLSDLLDAALAEVARQPFADTSRVALVGVNTEGYSVFDTQMRTGLADVVLTLDGREAKVSGTSTTRSLPHVDPDRLRVPYLAFSMDAPQPQFQPDEAFFESLRHADRQVVVLDGVEHVHYIGDLIAWPHLRAEVEPLYAALYGRVTRFLDTHVKGVGDPGGPHDEKEVAFRRRWPAQ